MNKKENDSVLATIIVILLAIASIGVIWAILHQVLQEPQFKITKEVCAEDEGYNFPSDFKEITCPQILVNETKCWLSEDGKAIVSFQNDNREYFHFYSLSKYNHTTAECHKEEVNEISVCDNEIKSKPRNYGFSGCEDTCCPVIILKQDLTKEWLEENSECVEYCANKECDVISNGKYAGILISRCAKYQLGNYTIEVLDG